MRLNERGHWVDWVTVGHLLKKRGDSLRVNAWRKESTSSLPERDDQFPHIDDLKSQFLAVDEPVIRVDMKKELIGAFKNPRQSWCSAC